MKNIKERLIHQALQGDEQSDLDFKLALARSLIEASNFTTAAKLLHQLASLPSDNVEFLIDLADSLVVIKEVDKAIPVYLKAVYILLKKSPNHEKKIARQRAIVILEATLNLKPGNQSLENLYLYSLLNTNNFVKAHKVVTSLLMKEKLSDQEKVNIAIYYASNKEFDQALTLLDELIVSGTNDEPLKAIAHFMRATIFFRFGEFNRGKEDYLSRFDLESAKPLVDYSEDSIWHGQSLVNKTLLLRYEQGMGDNIQLIRFINCIDKHNGKIYLECPRLLHQLFSNIDSIDKIIPLADGLPDISFNYQISVVDLAQHYLQTIDDIPTEVPYLKLSDSVIKKWSAKIKPSSCLNVGLVWQGKQTYIDDERRSVELEDFSKILQIEEVNFYSLQKDHQYHDIDCFTQLFNFVDLSCELIDVTDTAAAICQLDLVITVDTMVAHLAGALGRPVWILIYEAPHWVWSLGSKETPWYPTARLFRQHTPGQWLDVFADLHQALTEYVQDRAT